MATQNKSKSEIRLLLIVKLVVGLIIFNLVFLMGFIPNRWPFVWWNLYAFDRPWPANSVSTLELRVIDEEDQTYVVRPRDLYDILYKPAARNLGANVLEKAFLSEDPTIRIEYEDHLIERVQEKFLDAEITQLQLWEIYWDDFDIWEPQPFEYDQPDRESFYGSIEVAHDQE